MRHRGTTSSAALAATTGHINPLRINADSLFAAFEPVRPDEINRVVSRVTGLSANEHRFEQDLHLFLAGHTHVPLHHPIPVGNGRVVTYLNSGTWRRVHQLVKARDKGPPTFLTISEETTLCIHQRVGGEAPRYEFRRHARRL